MASVIIIGSVGWQLLVKMQQDFKSDWCTDEESLKTIKSVFKRTG